jgi:hypothetical protein
MTSCPPTTTIREWYTNLKEALRQDNHENLEQLHKQYQDAIKLLTKIPKNFEAWITN